MENQLIPCELCSLQMPVDQYILHLATHAPRQYEQQVDQQLQSFPISERNSNSALVETAECKYSGCTSQSFTHLRGTQRPVIPISSSLRTLPLSSSSCSSSSSVSVSPKDKRYVCGLIPAIDAVLQSNRNISYYYLCDKSTAFYYRGYDDYSWGCGFRNCQTLSSCLLSSSLYKEVMYGGAGHVPIISALQKYLDYAHAQGYDPQGMRELGSTDGTNTWIGAVDVAAMLRSFSVPAAIFDFEGSEALIQWVTAYFRQRVAMHEQAFIPPLYLQHDGHSRTIIGVMKSKKSGIESIMVLDPSVKRGGVHLLNTIKRNKNVRTLMRSKKQLGARKYQVVAVPAFGLMTSHDRNKCKVIQSRNVT